ncbi:MAG: hypothetical protein ACFCU4_00300 [Puniceicoccaceae bacterium]
MRDFGERDRATAVQERGPQAAIRAKVFGVGGGGIHILDRLKRNRLVGLPLGYAVLDCDLQTLRDRPEAEQLPLGKALTRGLGCGGDARLGKAVADSERDVLRRAVMQEDLVFILASLGGGLASGVAPVLAELAAEAGAFVVGLVSLPFHFEGKGRRAVAEQAVQEMRPWCDALVPMSNDLLMQETGDDRTALEVFEVADGWMVRAVEAMAATLSGEGLVPTDFASLCRALGGKGGRTLYTFGEAEGAEAEAVEAILKQTATCPLVTPDPDGQPVDHLLVHVSGGPELTLTTINRLVSELNQRHGNPQSTMFGASVDERQAGRLKVCVFGSTDLTNRKYLKPKRAQPGKIEVDPYQPLSHGSPSENGASGDEKAPRQTEFEVLIEGGNRGLFSSMERNLYKGEDLDVPTFIRRGVKVRA